MMKWMSFLLLLVCFSCKNNGVKIPNNILDKASMTALLVDVHIADGLAVNEKISDAKLLNQLKKSYLESTLEKHNVTKEKFESSLEFYEKNPQVLFSIYEKVMIEISTLEAEINGDKKEIKEEK